MWKMIAVPIVGAIIGYFTNWLAVKMLFHPRYEKKIGNWTLPFTPGVIPKGQPRLAKAVGKAVENQLLTADVMKKMLLSEDMKEKLTVSVRNWVNEQKKSELTVRSIALFLMDEESLEELCLFLQENGAEYLIGRLKEMDFTQRLTDKIMVVAQEKLQETVFGMMLGGGMLDSIGQMLGEKLDEYIDEKGQAYLERMIASELTLFQQRTVGDGVHLLDDNGFNLVNLTLEIYDIIINDYIDTIMKQMKLGQVVEERINSMRVEELEELVLAIMKNELGTIVNLGAIIGFVLGLLNVLIMCI